MNKNLVIVILFCLAFTASTAPTRDDDIPCDTMKCKDGETCTHITPACARGAAKCDLKGICIPTQFAPPDSNENVPRYARDLVGEFDPCAEMECENGEKCTSVIPFCPEDSICHPKGVCVAAPDELF